MTIEWVIERLISLIPSIGNLSKDKREIKDNALRSIKHALDETCLYVTRYVDVGKRDVEIEAQLVRYWSAAAIPIRHIDSELSQICEYKSEYWLNPSNWDPSKTKGISIELQAVREKYFKAKLH